MQTGGATYALFKSNVSLSAPVLDIYIYTDSGQSRIEEVGERIPSPPLPYSPLPSRPSLSFPSPSLPFTLPFPLEVGHRS